MQPRGRIEGGLLRWTVSWARWGTNSRRLERDGPQGKVAERSCRGIVVLGAVAIVFFSLGRTGSYQVLFSNLQPADAAEVVALLREQGVPHRIERNGSEIWVPEDYVAPARLELAAMGLPRGGVVGFEAFDTTRLGMTDFERQVQYQRALQGELTLTIRAFEQVQDARVHIALPERSLFVRDQGEPSASVVLQLVPGRTLDSSQVQAIVHLLARSVEGYNPTT